MSHMKGISEFKLEVQDFLDFLAVWYRDVLYFKATKDIDGLIFKDQAQSISDQANISSYEGIEEILKALQKAKTRLNANVNFELVIGLLFLLIKEN